MEKQLISALAVFIFCLLYTAAIAAQTKAHTTELSPEKTRAEVKKLGFGKRVKIRLHDGSKFSGRITGLADDQFVITNGAGTTMTVAYSELASIRKQREMPGILKSALNGIALTAATVATLTAFAFN